MTRLRRPALGVHSPQGPCDRTPLRPRPSRSPRRGAAARRRTDALVARCRPRVAARRSAAAATVPADLADCGEQRSGVGDRTAAPRRLCRHRAAVGAEHVLADAVGSAPEYVPKVAGELASLLAMWPHVLLLPTSRSLSLDDLLRLRAWPLHPLGVVAQPARADGAVRSVAEYFAHDVDHARYKVREDLRVRGQAVPDAACRCPRRTTPCSGGSVPGCRR